MAFLSPDQLKAMGFAHLGRNVLISDKAAIYGAAKISIGDHVRIDDFCVLSGHVTMGRNVHLSVFSNVAGGDEGITFEDFSGLSPGCHVFTQSDDYSGAALTNPTTPPDLRLETKRPVRLGRHCIVGTGSLVFPGVDLADGCAVGAMSMVTRSTEPWGVYAGVPARRVKDRSRALLEKEAQYLAAEES
jgi:acetyltransferase-like isoleucine patch superfamily enzyme